MPAILVKELPSRTSAEACRWRCSDNLSSGFVIFSPVHQREFTQRVCSLVRDLGESLGELDKATTLTLF